MIDYQEECKCPCCRKMREFGKLSMTYEEGSAAWDELEPGVKKPASMCLEKTLGTGVSPTRSPAFDRKDLLVWVDEIFKEAAMPDILASTRSFFGGKPKGWKP